MRRLINDDQGAVAISFAVTFFIGLALFLFSLDLARYNAAQSRLSNALDAAVISAGRKMEGFQANANQQDPGLAWHEDAKRFFHGNMPTGYMGSRIDADMPVISYEEDTTDGLIQRARMTVRGRLPLFLTGYLAKSYFTLGASNAAERRDSGSDFGGTFQGSLAMECHHPSSQDCYGFSLGPFVASRGEAKLYLNAFADDKTRNGSAAYRDIFHSDRFLWRDMAHNATVETDGANGLADGHDKQFMPRIKENRINVIDLHGDPGWVADDLIRNRPNDGGYSYQSPGDGAYGEKLVLTFTDAQNNVLISNPQVSIGIHDLSPGSEIRAAVFHDGAPLLHDVQVFQQADLRNGSVVVERNPSYGSAISRIVLGVENAGDAFAVGTDIRLGDSIRSDLVLVE